MMHGKNAEDLVVKVPIGTVVTEYLSPILDNEDGGNAGPVGRPGENEDVLKRLKLKNPLETLSSELKLSPPKHPIASSVNMEFSSTGERALLAKGGDGGFGNIHFSSTHRSPREFTQGQPGQTITLQLELKTIADVGLIGLPNAGKSSLLNAISNSNSKVANYPFTTLRPCLGSVAWPDYKRTIIADIPGLVEGAHRNYGLGHDFLRHIERTRVLVFVVDLANQPVRDMEILIGELEKYSPGLSTRPALIVGNKADIAPDSMIGLQDLQNWTRDKKYTNFWNTQDHHMYPSMWNVVPLSAKYEANLPTFYNQLKELLDHTTRVEANTVEGEKSRL
jgi:GTP-binding protein